MYPFFYLSLAFISLSLFACKAEPKQTDEQKIEANVRDFFFLTDSVDVNIEIVDTLFQDELEEMLTTVNQNLNLMDNDLDSLSGMIDRASYTQLNYENELKVAISKADIQDSLAAAKLTVLQYKLLQAELDARLFRTKQTNRILLHLKRSIWANIAGFNIQVSYTLDNDLVELDLLLDANFNVVD